MVDKNKIKPTDFAKQYKGDYSSNQMQLSSDNRFVVSLALLLGITIFLLMQLILFVAGDIDAGALKKDPETGWGFVYTMYIVTPLLLIFGISTVILARKLKNQGVGLTKTIIITTIVMFMVFIYFYLTY